MKKIEVLKDFGRGAAIGLAASIPGVSGGTVAVILKVYQKVVDAIGSIFKHFGKSFITLLPILLGVLFALVPCFFLFDWAFEYFAFGIVSLFVGLIVGSFPGVLDEVVVDKVSAPKVIVGVVALLITLGIGIGSVFFGESLSIAEHIAAPEWWFYFVIATVGVLGAIALVVPGISGSMLLLVLGFYKPLLSTATDMLKGQNVLTGLAVLGVFAIGVLVGLFTIAKLMSFLLNKHRVITFYAIVGFILGSTVTLFYNYQIVGYYNHWGTNTLPVWAELLISLVLFTGAIIGAYQLVRLGRKAKANEQQEQVELEENKEEQ